MSFYCRGCSICFPGPCPSGPIRIGYAHPDRLLGYPDVRYLSGCSLPIRMWWHPWGLGSLFSDGSAFGLVAKWCYSTMWDATGHVGAFKASSPISHVIPLRLLHTLNLRRWNCNVLRGARKMTVGNYVRLFSAKPGDCAVSRSAPAVARPRGRSRLPSEPAQCLKPLCSEDTGLSQHGTRRARKSPCALRMPQAQRKRGPASADPRLSRPYSWSSPRPRGVIWGHSRSMFASLPCLRRYFSKSSAQSW